MDPKDAIYVFQALVFGPTCFPSMSTLVKDRHVIKLRKSVPKASEVITKFTYFDDSSGSQPIVEAISNQL